MTTCTDTPAQPPGVFKSRAIVAFAVLLLAMGGLAAAQTVTSGGKIPEVLTLTVLIMLGTLVSEDLTCLAVGQMIATQRIGPAVGIGACAAGIVIGDIGLWGIGSLVRRGIVIWPWAARVVDRASAGGGRFLRKNLFASVLVSRFVPGSRLPLYLACGFLGQHFLMFVVAASIASLIWTPLIVLAIPLGAPQGLSARSLVMVAVGLVLLSSLVKRVGSLRSFAWCRMAAACSRVWRWEFWPSWVFYLPIAPAIAWLAIRHRGFRLITAANPGVPLGGLVGESKAQILDALASPATLPYLNIESGQLSARLAILEAWMQRNGETFPLILKPDVGERGTNVRLVRSMEMARDYLAKTTSPVLAQRYHPGPFEAGLFYVRLPGGQGRLYSITDKVFPVIIGDGRSTVEQLIWRDPRFRMQAKTFLDRHADRRSEVLAPGEHFRLGVIGNHCRGTLFRDGRHLQADELEARMDQIARKFDGGNGFFFGRFDVRYSNVDRFRAGEDLAIIELNGISSESTALYDPRHSLLDAYRELYGQWKLLFAIGAANVERGIPAASWRDLTRAVVRFLFANDASPTASD